MIYKLSDLCDYVKEKIDVKELTRKNYISTENMLPNKRGISIASSIPSILQTQAFKKGDILISNIRPYFKKIWYAEYDGGCSNDVLVLRAKKGVNKQYLYYLLADDRFFDYAMAFSKGTKMPRGDKTAIMNYSVISFSNEKQDNIAEILNVLDKKIFINDKINRNLYEQAVALFEAMYQGYPVKKIGELDIFVTDYVANGSFASLKENVIILEEKNYAYFIRNVDLKAKEFPRFVNQNSYEFLSKSKLVGGEVIISNVGDVGSVFLCPKLDGPMTLGNNMIMLTSPKHNNYLYLFFKSYIGQGKIGGITGGSAQPKFNKTDFKSLEINYPDESQVDEFNEKTSALLDMISKLDEENKRLTALRDSLLPKLMSGELDISDLDI